MSCHTQAADAFPELLNIQFCRLHWTAALVMRARYDSAARPRLSEIVTRAEDAPYSSLFNLTVDSH